MVNKLRRKRAADASYVFLKLATWEQGGKFSLNSCVANLIKIVATKMGTENYLASKRAYNKMATKWQQYGNTPMLDIIIIIFYCKVVTFWQQCNLASEKAVCCQCCHFFTKHTFVSLEFLRKRFISRVILNINAMSLQ